MADLMFDYDEPVYPFADVAHRILGEAGLTNGKPLTTWNFSDSYGCAEAEVWDVLGEHMESGELYAAPPRTEAIAQMIRLRGYGHRIHIVTARGCQGPHQDAQEAFTRGHIRRWNVPFDSLTFSKDKVAEGPFDYAIDDRPDAIEGFWRADYTCRAFLMDACHNQGVGGMPRVQSVKQFADIVLAVSV